MTSPRTIKTIAMALTIGATSSVMTAADKSFEYKADRFADIEVLNYKVPGFENLSLKQKLLVYHLTEAALAGRDIIWDQNCRYNLPLRQLIETIYTSYKGDRNSADFKAFEKYLKQVEFANGVHHHYSMDKFIPEFSREFFDAQVKSLKPEQIPAEIEQVTRLIFDPGFMAKRVNQAEGEDLILTSANNFYEGVTQPEVEAYFAAIKDTTSLTPVSYGLNTRITKVNGKVTEQPYKKGGLYSTAITRIIDNLNKAKE